MPFCSANALLLNILGLLICADMPSECHTQGQGLLHVLVLTQLQTHIYSESCFSTSGLSGKIINHIQSQIEQ
jgi:hypothetical protein